MTSTPTSAGPELEPVGEDVSVDVPPGPGSGPGAFLFSTREVTLRTTGVRTRVPDASPGSVGRDGRGDARGRARGRQPRPAGGGGGRVRARRGPPGGPGARPPHADHRASGGRRPARAAAERAALGARVGGHPVGLPRRAAAAALRGRRAPRAGDDRRGRPGEGRARPRGDAHRARAPRPRRDPRAPRRPQPHGVRVRRRRHRPGGTASPAPSSAPARSCSSARRGDLVVSNPLAGSAPRSPDPAEDARRAAALLSSAKDLHEHARRRRRGRRGARARTARRWTSPRGRPSPGPPPCGTCRTTHRGRRCATPRRPRWSSPTALHPTPGGVRGTRPTPARAAIEELEPFDRGFYTGIVGWCDADGDGEWVGHDPLRRGRRARAAAVTRGPASSRAPSRGRAGGDRAPSSVRCSRRSGWRPRRDDHRPTRRGAASSRARRSSPSATAPRATGAARPSAGCCDARRAAHGPTASPVVGAGPSGPQRWTYAELDARADRLAAGLRRARHRPRATASSCSCRTSPSSSRSSSRCSASAPCRCSRCPRTAPARSRYFCRARRGGRLSSSPAGTTASTTAAALEVGRGRRRRAPRGRRRATAGDVHSGVVTLGSLRRTPPGALPGDGADPRRSRSSSSPAAARACPS